ncbi:MAG: sugar phosphate isomerase/epimerase, partial [Planctomycetales bacterium]|nr:sugar phosphate isomerase/epimerase [Planctomycetales bacterium]
RGGPFVLWDDLPAACALAKSIGFDAVEIFAPSVEAIGAAQLRTLLDDHGLSLAAVGTGAGWVKHRLHLALPEASQRRAARDFIRTIIDFAGPFGAMAIIGSMQGRSGPGVDRAAARGYLAEALEELGEHAAQYGRPLLYEPLNRYETDQITTQGAGADFLQGLSTRNVRLLCDLFHMNIEEADVAQALLDAGDCVGHIHFVDSNRQAVGRGHLDVRPVMHALRQINYQGFLCAEAFPLPNPEAAARQTMAAYRYWTQSLHTD